MGSNEANDLVCEVKLIFNGNLFIIVTFKIFNRINFHLSSDTGRNRMLQHGECLNFFKRDKTPILSNAHFELFYHQQVFIGPR